MIKSKKGITLIALVITIIVLLILAGVTISMVVGQNGILKQASKSVLETKKGSAQEELALAWASLESEYWEELAKNSSTTKDSVFNKTNIQKELEKIGTVVSFDYDEDGKSTITFISDNDKNKTYTFVVEPDGNIEDVGDGYDFYVNAIASSSSTDSNYMMIKNSFGATYIVYSMSGQYIVAERYCNGENTFFSSESGTISGTEEVEAKSVSEVVFHNAIAVAPYQYGEENSGGIANAPTEPGTPSGYLQIYDQETNTYFNAEKEWYYLTKSGLKTDRWSDSACIDAETLVTMADGSLKKLGDIEVGDEVLSVDWDTKTLVSRKVIYSGRDEENYSDWYVNCYWENTFNDGTVIKQAMRHRFYCLEEESFKHLHDWVPGLHTYKIDGTNPELVSRELVQGQIHYARITLEDDNNYFANGLLTGDSESKAGIPLTEFLQSE